MSDQIFDFARELLSGTITKSRSDRELLAEFGERVRSSRMQYNLSRKELACKSGMSERYIGVIEAGKGNISIVLLFRLIEAFQRCRPQTA